jgi:hypothetical protein
MAAAAATASHLKPLNLCRMSVVFLSFRSKAG